MTEANPDRHKSCVIESDPFAVQIAEWLRQGLTATAVNANLKRMDPEHRSYQSAVISRHRRTCLGMAPLSRGGVARTEVKQTAKDVAEAENVSDADMLRTYKAALYDRLRKNPTSVSTKELVSAISALSRGMPAEDPGDLLTRAMGDLSDEAAPPSEP